MWWLVGLLGVIGYTLVKFELFKPTKLPKPEKEQVRLSPIHSTNFTNKIDTIEENCGSSKNSYYQSTSSNQNDLHTSSLDNELIVDMNQDGEKIRLASSNIKIKNKDV